MKNRRKNYVQKNDFKMVFSSLNILLGKSLVNLVWMTRFLILEIHEWRQPRYCRDGWMDSNLSHILLLQILSDRTTTDMFIMTLSLTIKGCVRVWVCVCVTSSPSSLIGCQNKTFKCPQPVQWHWFKYINTPSQDSDTDINI